MSTHAVHSLPYRPAIDYFEALLDLPYPVWLDSGAHPGELGRYDILSAAPRLTLSTSASTTRISSDNSVNEILNQQGFSLSRHRDGTITSPDDPFDLLDACLQTSPVIDAPELPFTGGALGYFGYNLGQRLEPRLPAPRRDVDLPDMQMGLYEWALILDHHRQQACLVATNLCPADFINDLFKRLSKPPKNSKISFEISSLKSNLKVTDYSAAIARIQQYIRAGDAYQVNFAQRFSAPCRGHSFAAYRHLRQLLPAPFSAYMAFPESAVLCHSPERFLKIEDRQVETRPIKGTMPRSPEPETDKRNAQTLASSAKDRAENLMIVDLLRNDLGKTCRTGSVAASQLFNIESYANVHHLVSQVTGELPPGTSPLQLFKGCFPGGSITGAPKIRAMEIIHELEPGDRSVYCGSIGYISRNGRADSNIAIRTLARDATHLYCWGGGGVVADSTAEGEYRESLDKIQVLLDGLGVFRA